MYLRHIHCIQAQSRWFNGTIVSAPSYLGQKFAARGPGEGLAVLGLIYGGALIGKVDFGGIDARFVSIYADPKGASLKILRVYVRGTFSYLCPCLYMLCYISLGLQSDGVGFCLFFSMVRCE